MSGQYEAPHLILREVTKRRIDEHRAKVVRKRAFCVYYVDRALDGKRLLYCIKLRRFVKRDYIVSEGIRIAAPGLYCPWCRCSHRDAHVQRHNPKALSVSVRMQRKDKEE